MARPGQEALVFRSGDAASLARELETLIGDPALQARLGAAARERANTYLTLERCATEYETVYQSLGITW